jgi:hypothetical protein
LRIWLEHYGAKQYRRGKAEFHQRERDSDWQEHPSKLRDDISPKQRRSTKFLETRCSAHLKCATGTQAMKCSTHASCSSNAMAKANLCLGLIASKTKSHQS